ncbi:hypothetical protein C3B54_111607 [Pontimonas salivibrio]|uniref:Uncharacterized protein n=1 Tax=Pontimonas salivibrio TaxID=1159327 RepID=A0A2L2BSF0_9MICO|nr:hypothetical protein [Pontimonas salivibrio]AVG24542.1 hypothetical protein C3B54_111607 [Pontimonas salivibrio]
MLSTFYLFLVNLNNISQQPENYSYNDAALWSHEATLAPSGDDVQRASTLAQRFAVNRQRKEPVEIELPGRVRWTVAIRAVGAQWLSAETRGTEPRGLVISYRAIVAVTGLSTGNAVRAPVLTVGMFQAVAESIRRNPRVVLGVGGSQFVGVVAHLADDYLELLPRPGLPSSGTRSRGPVPGSEPSSSPESVVIPLMRVDYLRWLEPGDSF